MTAQRETGRGRYRVGVIGAGVRAGAYFTNIPAELTGTIELAAVADPDPARREAFGKLFGGESATPYETGPSCWRRRPWRRASSTPWSSAPRTTSMRPTSSPPPTRA